MEPPIHVLHKRSGEAAILIFMSLGDKECLRTSLSNLSPKPGNMVLPPESTMFAYSVLRKSVSHLMRSEEHTSELQSLMRTSYAVFCSQKNKITKQQQHY